MYRGYILDLLEGGRKLIVFGHHKSVLDSISESLLNKVTSETITGTIELVVYAVHVVCIYMYMYMYNMCTCALKLYMCNRVETTM